MKKLIKDLKKGEKFKFNDTVYIVSQNTLIGEKMTSHI